MKKGRESATNASQSPSFHELGVTHSAFVSSSICCLAKLTGCAPGKLVWCRPNSSATSARMVLKRSPDAFTPGSESEVICDMVSAPVTGKSIRESRDWSAQAYGDGLDAMSVSVAHCVTDLCLSAGIIGSVVA